jgi:hypothetical protein
MHSQVVEVPKHIVEEEETTATGIDSHIFVWSLVEQDWARAREGMRARCPETGSREQARQAWGRVDRSYPKRIL